MDSLIKMEYKRRICLSNTILHSIIIIPYLGRGWEI